MITKTCKNPSIITKRLTKLSNNSDNDRQNRHLPIALQLAPRVETSENKTKQKNAMLIKLPMWLVRFTKGFDDMKFEHLIACTERAPFFKEEGRGRSGAPLSQ